MTKSTNERALSSSSSSSRAFLPFVSLAASSLASLPPLPSPSFVAGAATTAPAPPGLVPHFPPARPPPGIALSLSLEGAAFLIYLVARDPLLREV
mmetsp:Transcript_543/g.1525  ORF Transcript_543/g.1525 Transcript_543/m.1525 type:complete len:95 (+) Transcript_543:95-379(+)